MKSDLNVLQRKRWQRAKLRKIERERKEKEYEKEWRKKSVCQTEQRSSKNNKQREPKRENGH